MHSDVAVPLAISAALAPLGVIGIDCTSTPPGVYSSRKTGEPVLTSEPVPEPTRHTTTSPAVNEAAEAGLGESPSVAASAAPTAMIRLVLFDDVPMNVISL